MDIALSGLIGEIRNGNVGKDETVVFVHTGGTPIIFAYDELLAIVSEAGATVTVRYFDELAFEELKELTASTSSEVVFDTTG